MIRCPAYVACTHPFLTGEDKQPALMLHEKEAVEYTSEYLTEVSFISSGVCFSSDKEMAFTSRRLHLIPNQKRYSSRSGHCLEAELFNNKQRLSYKVNGKLLEDTSSSYY